MIYPDNLPLVDKSAYLHGWVRVNCYTVIFIRVTEVSGHISLGRKHTHLQACSSD